MPIYEYQCQECGHKLEVMQRMTDERLKTCPDCNKDALTKLISAVSFQLKGTGWYETDFKNSGKGDDKKNDGAGKGKTSDGSSTKASDGEAKSSDSGSKSADSSATPTSAKSGDSGASAPTPKASPD